MDDAVSRCNVVMLGTFSAWRLGTLQARALPFAIELNRSGIRCAIVTVPWDVPGDRGSSDVIARVPVLNTRSASLHATPLAVSEQIALVRRLRPQAIHLFKPKGFGGLSAAMLRRRNPLVVDSDDWEGDGGWNRSGHYGLLQRRVFDWQERTLLREARAVTAASTLLTRRARRIRSDAGMDRVWRLPNGLTASWYDALSTSRAKNERVGYDAAPTILLYSRFAEFGPSWVPRFVERLASRSTGTVHVRLVGDDGTGVVAGDSVCLEQLGYVARHRLPELLGTSNIAVFPCDDSLISRSKQSVKLLEMMAAGCAVVATDAGDVAQIVGNAGVLVRSSSPEVFADTVLRLLEVPARVRNLGAAAIARVHQHHMIETLTPILLAAYDHGTPSSGPYSRGNPCRS